MNEMEKQQGSKEYVYQELEKFGLDSMRTLVVSVGTKPREWWFGEEGKPETGWQQKYQAAQVEFRDAPKKMAKLEEDIERDAEMDLIGVTAIEDKLQDGVPATIKSLLDASIKMWVLTGKIR